VGRLAALIAALALCAPPAAAAKKKKRRPAAEEKEGPGPHTLAVRGVEPRKRIVHLELDGWKHPPSPHLFTLVDERGRRFVGVSLWCETAERGPRRCELELPEGYERHRLVGVGVHLGKLSGPLVQAPAEEVRAAWEAGAPRPGGERRRLDSEEPAADAEEEDHDE
jgi:hypothetical protein